MSNWLTKLAMAPKTDEQRLQDQLDTLPLSELNEISWSIDPSLRPTQMDAMQQKVAEAVRMGRELAQELDKEAGVAGLVGGLAKNLAVGAISNGVSSALKPAAGGFKYAGILQQAGGYLVRHPGTAATAVGAAGGALMAPRDQQTGQKQYLRGALMGGVAGAGANALSGGAIGNKMRSAVMNRESPILGQGVRSHLMDSARATKASYKPAVAGATAATPAPAAASVTPHPAAPPTMGPSAGMPKVEPGMRTPIEGGAMGGSNTSYLGGPTGGTPAVPQRPVAAAPEAAPQQFTPPPGMPKYWGGAVAPHKGSKNSPWANSPDAKTFAVAQGSQPMAPRPSQSAGTVKLAQNLSPADRIKIAAMQKKAFAGIDDVLGGVVGWNYGKKQKERGEEHSFGGKQVASLLLPGGAGYQIGRGLAHAHKEKKAFLIGGIAGHIAKGKDRDASPRSGFWRGAGGGILGGTAGHALGHVLSGGDHGAALIGNLAGQVGGGILAGRTARPSQTEIHAHHAGEAARHKAMLEKKANQQTLTYDPATKTFTRQHLNPSMASGSQVMGGTLADIDAGNIPQGHTEPVARGQQPSAHRGMPQKPVNAQGSPSGVFAMHGGQVETSAAPGYAPQRGPSMGGQVSGLAGAPSIAPSMNTMAATPAARMPGRAAPPPIPAAAMRGGPAGLAGAAAHVPMKTPLLGALAKTKIAHASGNKSIRQKL